MPRWTARHHQRRETGGVPVREPLFDLVHAAGEGDDRAVRALVDATGDLVARVCTALGSGTDVDDLVQETYIRAMRGAAAFRGDAPVAAWLVAIARRVCADAVRRRRRQRRLTERLRSTAIRTDDTVDLDGLDDGGLGALVLGLDPDRREAFVLTRIVGLSYEEAATVLGCPIGTVRSRVARARADLRAAVEFSSRRAQGA